MFCDRNYRKFDFAVKIQVLSGNQGSWTEINLHYNYIDEDIHLFSTILVNVMIRIIVVYWPGSTYTLWYRFYSILCVSIYCRGPFLRIIIIYSRPVWVLVLWAFFKCFFNIRIIVIVDLDLYEIRHKTCVKNFQLLIKYLATLKTVVPE